MDRRDFSQKLSLAAMASILGTKIVFGDQMPATYLPLGLQDSDPFKMFNKDREMVVLNDRPWNMEAQAHLLNDKITPNKFMFIRNNGKIPENIDSSSWTLTIDGESVNRKKNMVDN